MADLGAIATASQPNWYHLTGAKVFTTLRCMVCGDGGYQVIGGRDTTEGDPSQPSLRMDSAGMWRFRWTVLSGARTITIGVKQAANASPRPTLVVKANPNIGVNADVTETAGAAAGWIAIGPAAINPTSDGAVEVQLWNNLDRQFGTAPCYFDTESITTT